MSAVTSINRREAVPVLIYGTTVWCESFSAEQARTVYEKPSVAGKNLTAGSFPRRLKLTIAGRVCDEDYPLAFIADMNSLVRSGASFSVSYRGLEFPDCLVAGFKAEDKGEAYAEVSVTLLGYAANEEAPI